MQERFPPHAEEFSQAKCTADEDNRAGKHTAANVLFPVEHSVFIHYNGSMFRLFVERKAGFQNEAQRIFSEITGFLGIAGVTGVRYLNRYDIENTADEVSEAAAVRIFSEPQSDFCARQSVDIDPDDTVIVWEYLPGQYDQRSDSAEQCLLLLREGMRSVAAVGSKAPRVRCAKVVILSGAVTADEVRRIQRYLINPVDSRLTDGTLPDTLEMRVSEPDDVPVVSGFVSFGAEELESYRRKLGLAMDFADIRFLQDYFISIKRDPTLTEIRVLDTYWSDHCRHTTFNTILKDVRIEDGAYSELFRQSLRRYEAIRAELYAGRADKPVSLMDMAVIGAKYLRKHGKLDDLEVSEENNACSIYIDVHYTSDKDGRPLESGTEETERWLLEFKNETHNHPTEIEPFGGAATCIGGAIRDPLSARSWVYQALRVSGAADPTVALDKTLPGKLPQIKLTREAAQGFSSYGNQIGLATGQVAEIYHPGFVAKRMELGAVIAAAPADLVMRETPEAGDVVILLGGGTGRDGIGGATGSSKMHTAQSVSTAAAEVQKGNAVEERKIQRLFRNPAVSRIIRRCNDFGAGGISVAVGELAPGLDINLDAVPKKYEGLDGTELAISESQERMAVVVRKARAAEFIAAANAENLNAVEVATVTDTQRMVMRWRGKIIVDIDRSFIDTAGAPHEAAAVIESPAMPAESPLVRPLDSVAAILKGKSATLKDAWLANMRDLACCSQRGLGERFDGSIGAASVLMPYGGFYQGTPEAGMAAKIPVPFPRETSTVSLMSYGYDPRVSQWSPWHGAQIAVLSSLAKILCMGGNPESCRLSFQEFFGRTVDEKSWGYPAAALLGALDAQTAMGTGSIGGKDSMSGTFENLSVPHTLVSFAVATEHVKNVTSGSFKCRDSSVYLVDVPYSDTLAPDFEAFKRTAETLYRLNSEGKIFAMYPVGAGGIAEALSKMVFGNRIGFVSATQPFADSAQWFRPRYGAVIVETNEHLEGAALLGRTCAEKEIAIDATRIPLAEIQNAWESTLAAVFPPVSVAAKVHPLIDWDTLDEDGHTDALGIPYFAQQIHGSLQERRAAFTFSAGSRKPRVIIPVFPGTNCEYDMARAFTLNGADARMMVFRNRTPQDLAQSLDEFQKEIGAAQIVAFAGGFSAGDEPDGSGKYIANVIRERRIADAIMALLRQRDGLVLGICNGFQALIKTGLVPFGEIREPSADMPTLTFNTIGRHISRVVMTRMVSAKSPWALHHSVLAPYCHLIPVSHGEGRVIISGELAKRLFADGQIFSQYVDENRMPTMNEPDNPNGSMYAIEGMTSPDGRVLGKMGHNERTMGTGINGESIELIKNVAGFPIGGITESSCQNIFAAGVAYFK